MFTQCVYADRVQPRFNVSFFLMNRMVLRVLNLMSKMLKRNRIAVTFFVIYQIFNLNVSAQNLLTQGALKIDEGTPTPDLNGSPIVPPLQENEGLIIIKVTENQFFTSKDVVEWLKSGRMTLQGLQFDRNRVMLTEDEQIRFKYTFRFLSGTDQVGRRMQIRIDNFKTYYKSHRFYKQQVIPLTLSVEEAPTFDQPIIQLGLLKIAVGETGAEVRAIDENGDQQGSKIVFGEDVELEVPVGKYNIFVRKSGFEEFIQPNVIVRKQETTSVSVKLKKTASAVATVADEGIRVEFQSNIPRAQMTLLSTTGEQKSLLVFDGRAIGQVQPGRYNIIANQTGFVETSFTMEIGEDDTNKIVPLRMVKEGDAELISIDSRTPRVQVWVDGEFTGVTPKLIQKPERKLYKIELKLEGFATFDTTIDMAIQNTVALSKELTQSFIEINTRSDQGQFLVSDVILNGENVGKTPFLLNNPPEKSYTLQLKSSSYETVEREIDLSEKGWVRMDTSLIKLKSSVRVYHPEYELPVNLSMIGVSSDTDNIISPNSAELDKKIRYGTYLLSVEKKGFKPFSKQVEINSSTSQVDYELEPKSKVGSFILSIVPGMGQLQWGHTGRGVLFMAAFGGAAYMALGASSDYGAAIDTYNSARSRYQQSDQASLGASRSAMNTAFDDMVTQRDNASLMIGVALGVYGVNLLDRLLTKSAKRQLKKNRRELPKAAFKVSPTGASLTISLGR